MSKAKFTVGVFGLPCCQDEDGTLRIKVNVRTDQERQRRNANLPDDSTVKIVDMLGGGVQTEDFPEPKQASLVEVLRREVSEETSGCTMEPLAEFSEPVMHVANNQDDAESNGDIAFWMPIRLFGEPKESSEAAEHPWITLQQLEDEMEYRSVGGLGKAGRTGRMIRAAFQWYDQHRNDYGVFSSPEDDVEQARRQVR